MWTQMQKEEAMRRRTQRRSWEPGNTRIGKKASIPVGPKATFPDCPERTFSSTEKVGSHSCHPNGESPLLWSVTADVFCELRL